jgi:hypothetical protein
MSYKIEEKTYTFPNGEEKTLFIVVNESNVNLIKFTTRKQAEKFIEDMEKGGVNYLSDRIKYRS